MKFTPPPLVKKPPHPFSHIPKPAWTKKIYVLGLVLWVIFFQLIAMPFLFISNIHPQRIEGVAIFLGIIVGHIMTLSIMQKFLSHSQNI